MNKTDVIRARLTDEEKAAFQTACGYAGVKASRVLRDMCVLATWYLSRKRRWESPVLLGKGEYIRSEYCDIALANIKTIPELMSIIDALKHEAIPFEFDEEVSDDGPTPKPIVERFVKQRLAILRKKQP